VAAVASAHPRAIATVVQFVSCSSCARLRKRIAEELAKFKARLQGPVQPRGTEAKAAVDRQGRPVSVKQAIALRRARISRRYGGNSTDEHTDRRR
jgi:hypothetical protein